MLAGLWEAMSISVVVNAKDSVSTIGFTLRSVAELADEVIVLDMESTDGTDAVARAHGARVIPIATRPIADTTREFAIEQTSGAWVLMLDGDELVAPGLAADLRVIATRDDVDAVRIPMVNYLIGAPLKHTSWSPRYDRHWRFFRPDALVWPGRIHTMPTVVEGRVGIELPFRPGHTLVHFNYLDTAHFLAKLDRYTELEADRLEAAGFSPWRALWAMLREFGVRYVLRQGFRDGGRGLHVSLLMVIYRYLSHAKVWERQRVGRRADIQASYAAAAERWLAGEAE